VSLSEPVEGTFYVAADGLVHAISTDGVGKW